MSCEESRNIFSQNIYNSDSYNCTCAGAGSKPCANGSFSTIYLVRHGQTIGNASRIFLDPTKEVLSPKGRLQASAAGEQLSCVKFDRAYASSLVRAQNTAKIILQCSKDPPNEDINFDDRIKEVDYGIFKGQSYDEPQKLRGKNVDESYPYKDFYVEGTEELELVVQRLESFLDEILENLDQSPEPETVLIVSHANLIRILMKYITLTPEKYIMDNFTNVLYTKCLRNTAYHKFQIGRRSPNCKACSAEPRIIRFGESHTAPHLQKNSTRIF